MLELGIGDEGGTGWIRSGKNVLIELGEIDRLVSSLRKARNDVSAMGLINENYEASYRSSHWKRWGRI